MPTGKVAVIDVLSLARTGIKGLTVSTEKGYSPFMSIYLRHTFGITVPPGLSSGKEIKEYLSSVPVDHLSPMARRIYERYVTWVDAPEVAPAPATPTVESDPKQAEEAEDTDKD